MDNKRYWNELAGAHYLSYDEELEMIVAWHGGVQLTVYNDEPRQIGCFHTREQKLPPKEEIGEPEAMKKLDSIIEPYFESVRQNRYTVEE